MLYQLLIAACLSVVGSTDTRGYVCPSGISSDQSSKVFGQTCYQFVVNQRKYYEDAQSFCKTHGGQLAIAKTQGVIDFIGDTLQTYKNIGAKSAWVGVQNAPKDQALGKVGGFRLGEKQPAKTCAALIIGSKSLIHYPPCDSAHLNNNMVGDSSKKIFVCEYPAVMVTVDDCPKTIPRDEYLQIHGSMCYKFDVKDLKNFDEADFECKRHGGRLATVNSRELQTYIVKELSETYGLRDNSTWIGLIFHPDYETLVWLDGSEQLSYYNFRENIFRHHCFAVSSYDGKWVSERCEQQHLPYICDFKPTPHVSSATTSRPESTTQKVSTSQDPAVTTTCAPIICELYCGMDGFKKDAVTGCWLCECVS